MILFTFTTMKSTLAKEKAKGQRLKAKVRTAVRSAVLFLAFSVQLLAFSMAAQAAPNITGSAARMINDNQSTQPFSDLDINNAANVTVTITFPEANGTLSPTTASFT